MKHQEKSFADYVAAILRRSTVALFSFVVVFVVGVYLAYSLPAIYRSTAIISIEQQDVSPDLVEMAVTTYADEQIQRVWQRVMSSDSLNVIIDKYALYPDLVVSDPSLRGAREALRANTLLEPQSVEFMSTNSRNASSAIIAFWLSFDHEDAVTAEQVATEFANLYLKENVDSRANQAQLTVDFLKLEIDNARAQADRAAEELAQFKERHAGNLPELLNFHLQSIERTEQQLDNLDREIRDSRNRKFTIETELARTNPFGNAVGADGTPILGTADRLAELQSERLRLLSIYTPEHADVIRIEREIDILTGGAAANESPAELRAQLDELLGELQQARLTFTEDHPDVVRLKRRVDVLEQQLEQALAAGSQQSSLASLAARDPVVQQLQQQAQTEESYLRSLMIRRNELESKLEELRGRVAAMPKLEELRGRVAAMPQVEREYETLAQQNEFAIQRYNDAVERIDAAQRSQTLEMGGGSERFTLVEAPFLPEAPYSPNRPVIIMLVIMVAVGTGIGLAVLIDSLDVTVKDSIDLTKIAGAPPLAVIPVIETQADRRRRLAATAAKGTFFLGGLAVAAGIAMLM
jgi:uncharacterized protein involved in exopolysaccharide biosynthesis